MKLSQTTIEILGYYVYLLRDPSGNIFYVGKGHGNRINQHVFGALRGKDKESKKVRRVKEIESSGQKVIHQVLRHDLTQEEAFEVEAAAIDLIGLNNLTNVVDGHDSDSHGLMSLEDIEINYQAEDAEFSEPAILININNYYPKAKDSNDPNALYEATRKHWVVNRRRASRIALVCAVYLGIIREVFIVQAWHESPDENEGRSYFVGEVALDNISNKYLNKSVKKYWEKGSRNPIKYIGDEKTWNGGKAPNRFVISEDELIISRP